jgi:2-C-methyl-D-erythritol 4-phosphate cytidylyltransferase
MKKYIIIVAGGTGRRMNNDVPKQFMLLRGMPILMHTIKKFADTFSDITIILVLAPQLTDEWKQLCVRFNFTIPHQITTGGNTRFHSVGNGLMLVPKDCIVGVHDAARPLVSRQTIINTFRIAEIKGNAIPALPLTESLREINGDSNRAVNRNNYFMVQTPQCFHSTLLKNAFSQPYSDSFTDDASVIEAMGTPVNLIDGNRENIKITTQQDIIIAGALMDAEGL